ncbi:hypothetical protein [Pseudomonas sp. B392_1p]|uniref:hypothetical protein n=1 Tax=Pseudomonas sp. B392_1p TaxID=3457507 RepID=UPI003FD52FEE
MLRLPRPLMYTLVDRRAVACEDPLEWSRWYACADSRVAQTLIDDVRISTVFLGLDHNPLPTGDPILFETMVFVGDEIHSTNRYFIWEEAEAGHAEMVERIRAEMSAAQVEVTVAWERVLQQLQAE